MVTKQRSPNYPSIALGAAVDRIRQLYPNVQRGEFTPQDAARSWGYSSVSGPVRRTMGALRQYGLIDQKKGDNAKLTNRALTLALREPESREYRSAMREAALEPPLFAELHENGKAGAASDALRQYLVVEKQFTREGATQFIEVFRATRGLANLDEDDNIAGLDEVQNRTEEPTMEQAPRTGPALVDAPGTRSIQIPLPGNPWATLQAPFPMSETTWKQMMDMLKALKPGLVEHTQIVDTVDTEGQDGEDQQEEEQPDD